MVAILLFCGTRCLGAADYFDIESEVFFVHTLFYHFWFVPLCPLESFVSKVSDTCGFFTFCNKSYVVRLPEIQKHTVMWAWVRVLTLILPAVPVLLAFLFDFPGEGKTPVLFCVLIAVGSCLFLLWPLSLIYKPKASPERREKYLQIIRSAVAAARKARPNTSQAAQTARPPDVPQAARMPQPNMQQAAKIVTGKKTYRPMTDDAANV